jgi:hypothetical protein
MFDDLVGDCWMTLLPADLVMCDGIADRRQTDRERDGHVSYAGGGPSIGPGASFNHRLGVYAECAGKYYFDPVVWNNGPLQRGEPDLHDFIDIKGRTREGHDLIVRPPQLHADWAYVLATPCPNDASNATWRLAYVVLRAELPHELPELLAILRADQALGAI